MKIIQNNNKNEDGSFVQLVHDQRIMQIDSILDRRLNFTQIVKKLNLVKNHYRLAGSIQLFNEYMHFRT